MRTFVRGSDSPLPHRVSNRAADAAVVWMLLFAGVHVYWGAGGSAGLPDGLSVYDSTGLLIANWAAVPLSIIGAGLALALSARWRAPVRPALLLGAAWFASAAPVVHALPTIVEAGRIALNARTAPLSEEERYSFFLYEPYWLLGGILLGFAAWTYGRHRRRQRDQTVRAV